MEPRVQTSRGETGLHAPTYCTEVYNLTIGCNCKCYPDGMPCLGLGADHGVGIYFSVKIWDGSGIDDNRIVDFIGREGWHWRTIMRIRLAQVLISGDVR